MQLEQLERALLWLQTSSTSALLLLSAEQAVARSSSAPGRCQLQVCLKQASDLAAALQREGVPLLQNQDPLRLIFH